MNEWRGSVSQNSWVARKLRTCQTEESKKKDKETERAARGPQGQMNKLRWPVREFTVLSPYKGPGCIKGVQSEQKWGRKQKNK